MARSTSNMEKDFIVTNEHLEKVPLWKRIKWRIWRRKNYKRISIWVRRKDGDTD